MTNKMKIVFAPGSLDEFDGTQEDLDNLVQGIRNFIESEEFQLNMVTDDNITVLLDEFSKNTSDDYKWKMN